MKIDRDHALMVRTLAKNPRQILAEITPGRMNLLHAAVGICGEAGELLDSVKKACIYNQTIDTVNLIEELGDLEFYMEQLRQECGITREETLAANMDKLSLRYKEMHFSNEAAQARKDKMIVNESGRLDIVSEPRVEFVTLPLTMDQLTASEQRFFHKHFRTKPALDIMNEILEARKEENSL